MKQRFPFRILALLLACCLVFSGCSNVVIARITENLRKYKQGSSHTGGGLTDWADFGEAPENSFYSFLSEYKQSANLSGLTPLGLKPETPQTGPANDWGDTPIPLINPLGSKALYNGVYHRNIGEGGASVSFTYLEGFSEVSKTIDGEKWELKIHTNGGDVLPFLREYAEKLGAEFYTTTSDGEMAFCVRQPEAYYWCTAVYSERASEVQVDMVKARVFTMNKAYKITKDMYDEQDTFEFLVDMPGKKFTQILCDVPDGGLWLEINQMVESDSMKAEIVSDRMMMFSQEYTHYTLYNCPQDAGLYRVSLQPGYEDYKSLPSEFTITFHETEYDLPGYKPGGIGELVVKNVPSGRVRAVTQKSVRIDNKLTGDRYGYDPGAYGQLEKLPTEATGKLSDTFTMNVTASEVKTGIDQYKSGDNAAFRMVEANFSSNVQALLDINPAERVWLRYPSKSGDLLAPMSPVTQFMPMGFWDQVMLGPGSDNIVRLAYDVPARLDKHKCELYFDIATGSAVFGVTEGKPYGASAPAAEFDTEFMKVRVNQLVQLQEDLEYPSSGGWTSSFSKGSVFLDVTFIDKPSADGYQGTQIPADFFTLVNKNYESPYSAGGVAGSVISSTGHIGLGGPTDGSKELVNPSYYNKDLIFGMEGGLSLFGSMSRRAIVIFDRPEDDISAWTLQSRYYSTST